MDKFIDQIKKEKIFYVPLYKITKWARKSKGDIYKNCLDATLGKQIRYPAKEVEQLDNNGKVDDIFITTIGVENLYTKDSKHFQVYKGEIISLPRGGNPNIKYHKGKYIISNSAILFSSSNDKILTKYIFYYLLTISKKIEIIYQGSGLKNPELSHFLEIKIPIISVELQEQLVAFLDLIYDHYRELKNEKKIWEQIYEKFIDNLILFDHLQHEKWKKNINVFFNEFNLKDNDFIFSESSLGKEIDVVIGKEKTKKFILNNAGEYPVYSSSTLNDGEMGRINHYEYDGEYLTCTTRGEAGRLSYRNHKFSISSNCMLLKNKKQNINLKYFNYYLNKKVKRYIIKESERGILNLENFLSVPLIIPSIKIQNIIVEFLTNFEKLLIYKNQGLFYEFTLRKEQFEEYNNWFFKEIKRGNYE